MADNVYALLRQAWALSKGGDADIYGVEIAIVTNTKDPEKQGRVKVCFPRLPGKPESDWVRVAQPAAGPGRGFYFIPDVNDEVVVAFERGQANRPYILGSLWNGKDKPPEDAYSDDDTVQVVQTRSGHRLELGDKDGEEKIVLADKSGKRTLKFDVKEKKFTIAAKEGDVELHAEKKIVLHCEDLEIRTSKSGKLEIGSDFDVKVAQKATLAAGSTFDLKGSKVNLNPPSLDLEDLAAAALKALRTAAGKAGTSSKAGQEARGGNGDSAARGGDLSTDVVPAQGRTSSRRDAGSDAAKTDEGGAPASTTPIAPTEIAVQIFSAAGVLQKELEVELVLPGGEKRAGKTDANGLFKVERVSQKGNAHLEVPDVQVGEAGPASAGRVRYVVGGIDVAIGQQTAVELPRRVRRCRLSGLNFETNKTFLLPSAMTGMQQLVKLFKSFDGLVALVNGHTDKQLKKGFSPEVNRTLSVERSDSMKAFLQDDAQAWQRFYAGTPHSAKWDVREDQMMLATVKDAGGAPFYEGPIDGEAGPATKDAYARFQESRLLTRTRRGDSETRLELTRAYMALEKTSLPKGAQVQTHGCGQTHPLPGTEDDPDPDQPKNRRVEVFLFEEKIDPPPRTPCPSAGCEEHAKWVAQQILDVDLDQPPGALKVTVVDESGAAVPGANVHASGPLALDGPAPASFEDLIPGSYKVIANADGLLAADETAVVPAGGAADVRLVLKSEAVSLDVRVEDKSDPPQPLEGAAVSIDAPGAEAQTTGKDGLAHFVKLPRGKFTITATHERFEAGSIEVQLPLAPPPERADAKGLVSAAKETAPGQPPVVALNRAAGQPPFLRMEVRGIGAEGTLRALKGTTEIGTLKFKDGKLSLADIPAEADRVEILPSLPPAITTRKPNGDDEGHYVVTKPDGTLLIAGQIEQGKFELRQRPAADPANPKTDWVVTVRSFGARAEGAGFRKVKHFFVLMLENRSFDHMLGHNRKLLEADTIEDRRKKGIVDSNPIPGRAPAEATTGAANPVLVDPGHEFDHVKFHLFRNDKASPNDPSVPNMQGFAEEYLKRLKGTDPFASDPEFKANIAGQLSKKGVKAEDWAAEVMKGFAPSELEILNTLAEEYAVCDRWFSALPGPTCPSRLFIHAASSAGLDDSLGTAENIRFGTGGILFDNGTIFDRFKASTGGAVARAFVVGGLSTPLSQVGLINGVGINGAAVRVKDVHQGLKNHFEADDIKGKAGSYTFLEPDYGSVDKVATGDPTKNFINGESQHPPGDVKKGEKLIKDVFEAIFGADSPIRNESALIITYDEHGGYFDHVPPPLAISATNSKQPGLGRKGFNFGRYGVRVPAVIVSPLIPRGVVDHTIYDPTSLLKTLEERFTLLPLTERDKFANDFAHLFTLDTPRTTFPTLPAVATLEKEVATAEAAPTPEELSAPVSDDGRSYLSALGLAAVERVPERKADVLRRLEEIRTVGDAIAFADDMAAAPLEVVVRVTDSSGTPLPGARVKLAFATVHEARTSTGGDGQQPGSCRFKDVVPGKYAATVEAVGALPVTKQVVVPAQAEGPFVLPIAAEAGQHISLVLLQDDGATPVANAAFRAFLDPGAAPHEGQTDGKGALKIPGVRAGDFKLDVAGLSAVVPAIPDAIEQLRWVLAVPEPQPGNAADLLPPQIEYFKVFRLPAPSLFPATAADERARENEIASLQLAATSEAAAPAAAQVMVAWQVSGNLKSLALEGIGSVLEVTAGDGTGSRLVRLASSLDAGAKVTFTLRAEPADASQGTKTASATVTVSAEGPG